MATIQFEGVDKLFDNSKYLIKLREVKFLTTVLQCALTFAKLKTNPEKLMKLNETVFESLSDIRQIFLIGYPVSEKNMEIVERILRIVQTSTRFNENDHLSEIDDILTHLYPQGVMEGNFQKLYDCIVHGVIAPCNNDYFTKFRTTVNTRFTHVEDPAPSITTRDVFARLANTSGMDKYSDPRYKFMKASNDTSKDMDYYTVNIREAKFIVELEKTYRSQDLVERIVAAQPTQASLKRTMYGLFVNVFDCYRRVDRNPLLLLDEPVQEDKVTVWYVFDITSNTDEPCDCFTLPATAVGVRHIFETQHALRLETESKRPLVTTDLTVRQPAIYNTYLFDESHYKFGRSCFVPNKEVKYLTIDVKIPHGDVKRFIVESAPNSVAVVIKQQIEDANINKDTVVEFMRNHFKCAMVNDTVNENELNHFEHLNDRPIQDEVVSFWYVFDTRKSSTEPFCCLALPAKKPAK